MSSGRPRRTWFALLTAWLVCAGALTAPARADDAPVAESSGSWTRARVIPGLDVQDANDASVHALSCSAVGDCAAIGNYNREDPDISWSVTFLVDRVNGVWQEALIPELVPTLPADARVHLASLSCGAPASCSAVGLYSSALAGGALVIDKIAGKWRKARPIPGVRALGGGRANAVSCTSASDCSAAGYYVDEGAGIVRPFVVSRVNGSWGRAAPVAGLGPAGSVTQSSADLISCASPGNCSVGGYYRDLNAELRGFVVDQVDGRWRAARTVDTSSLGMSSDVRVTAIDCPSSGHCSAIGVYMDQELRGRVFLLDRVAGVWQAARPVPGLVTNDRLDAEAHAISCSSAGNCAAGGRYGDSAGRTRAFVVDQVRGAWRAAREILSPAGLRRPGEIVAIDSVSCPSGGACTAVGAYENQAPDGWMETRTFSTGQVDGRWQPSTRIAASLLTFGYSSSNAYLHPLSCPAPGHCSTAGIRTGGFVRAQPWIADQG